jgi:hypothetical protein
MSAAPRAPDDMATSKITVSLDDEIVEWARAEALRKGVPLGLYLGSIVTQRMLIEHAMRGSGNDSLPGPASPGLHE